MATHIGRIGALAVALGIGTAIAYAPAVALADDDTSASSSDTSSSEASSADSGSAADSDTSTTDAAESEESASDSDDESGQADTSDDDDDGDDSRIRRPRTLSGSHEPDEDDAVEQESAEQEPQPEPVDLAPVTSHMFSALDSGPSSTNTPEVPAQQPAMWTVLAYARRELGLDVATPTVSPLGTPEQIAAEKLATQTANTLPVQLTKLVLKASWLLTAQREYAVVGGPDQQNLDALDAAVTEYAMAAAFQQQILNSNTPTVVTQVAPPHMWFGQSVTGSRNLYDNPDTVYRFMGVNKASSYVITGRFENYDPNDPSSVPTDTTFSVLTGLSGNTAQVLTKDDLIINPDGTFVITVSGEEGEPGTNHLQLTSDSTLIAARNTLGDWENETPMTLSIVRVDGPPNSLFSELGGFAIPFIGPAVADNPTLTALVSLVPPLPYTPPILRGTFAAVIMLLGIQNETRYIQVATVDPVTGDR